MQSTTAGRCRPAKETLSEKFSDVILNFWLIKDLAVGEVFLMSKIFDFCHL